MARLDWLIDATGPFSLVGAVAIVMICLAWAVYFNGGLEGLLGPASTRRQASQRNEAGVALLRQQDFESAIKEFSAALRLNPRLGASYTNRGAAYFQIGNFDEALADLDAAVDLSPNPVDAHAWRAQVWAVKGDPQRALADCNEVLRRRPGDLIALTHRASLLLNSGEYHRALDDVNLALTLGSREGILFAMRGSLHLARDEYDRALEDCSEGIRLGANSATDYSNRGMAWLGKGEWARAIADCDEAIRRDPSFGLGHNNRGVAFFKSGEYARAAADFRDAMRLWPEHPNAYKNLAWLQATCPEPQFRDGRQALAMAQKALQLVENKFAFWFSILAAAHAEVSDFEQAIQWQKRCLEGSPEKQKHDLEAQLKCYEAGLPFRDHPRGSHNANLSPHEQSAVRARG
jgi:tetratricopeptide (TPR) repeat protein